MGDRRGALDTIQAAFATYTEIESAHDWHDTLRMMAAVQIKSGDLRGALATVDTVLEIALLAGSHGGGSASVKARALADLAVVQKEVGDGKGASATFGTALATAEAISDADEKSRALTAIASAQARASDPERNEAEERPDGGQAGVAGARVIAAVGLEMAQEVAEQGGVEVIKRYRRGRLVQFPLPEARRFAFSGQHQPTYGVATPGVVEHGDAIWQP